MENWDTAYAKKKTKNNKKPTPPKNIQKNEQKKNHTKKKPNQKQSKPKICGYMHIAALYTITQAFCLVNKQGS